MKVRFLNKVFTVTWVVSWVFVGFCSTKNLELI